MTSYIYTHKTNNNKVYIIAKNILMSKLILDKYYNNSSSYTLNNEL